MSLTLRSGCWPERSNSVKLWLRFVRSTWSHSIRSVVAQPWRCGPRVYLVGGGQARRTARATVQGPGVLVVTAVAHHPTQASTPLPQPGPQQLWLVRGRRRRSALHQPAHGVGHTTIGASYLLLGAVGEHAA